MPGTISCFGSMTTVAGMGWRSRLTFTFASFGTIIGFAWTQRWSIAVLTDWKEKIKIGNIQR